MIAPDLVEPAYGWRVWRVAVTRSGLRLWSVIYDEAWQPGAAYVASCRLGHAAHDAPGVGCSCGVHATRSTLDAARYLLGRNDAPVMHRVVGLVALWGRVLAGPAGWRAGIAYPRQLWIPSGRHADEVAHGLDGYGVPLRELRPSKPNDVAAELALQAGV